MAANWRSNSDLTSKFLLLCEIEHDGACQRLARLKRSVRVVVELYFARSHHFGRELFEFTLPQRLGQRQLVASGVVRKKSDDLSALDGCEKSGHQPTRRKTELVSPLDCVCCFFVFDKICKIKIRKGQDGLQVVSVDRSIESHKNSDLTGLISFQEVREIRQK